MPATLDKREDRLDPEVFHKGISYDNYPEGLDLSPQGELHKKLLSKINERARNSKNVMSNHYDSWRRVDKALRLYAKPDYKTGLGVSGPNISRKSKDEEEAGKSTPLVIMPMSQARLETLMTYMSAAFFNGTMFKYDGSGPEDVVGAMLMQQVVHQMVERNSVKLNAHTLIRDSFAYGFGAAQPMWEATFGARVYERPVNNAFARIAQMMGREGKTEKVVEPGIIYEGVSLTNIDPYRYFPDTTVNVYEPQKGEFVSWLIDDTYGHLLSREKDENDFLFNVRYLKGASGTSPLGADKVDEYKQQEVSTHSSLVEVLWMYIDLIPNDWGLGSEKYPEGWVFGVAANKVIIAAKPLDFVHGEKPVVVAAPDFDGHNFMPSSRMESLASLQAFTDFLFTSRIANQRKSLNDMFVVDPTLINIFDLMNPAPGKLIRTRKSNWGRGGLDQAIKQLTVADSTQSNLGEIQVLGQLANSYSGIPDTMQGDTVNRGPRISATAAGGARSSSFSKLERLAQVIDIQAMRPMGRHFASHVQQFLEEPVYVKMVGESAERLNAIYGAQVANGQRIEVSPMDLLVNYDLMTTTSVVPGSQDPNSWIQLMQVAATMPDPTVIQSLDFPKIFLHIAKQLGTNNPEDFIRQTPPPTVMPDEQVAEQEAQGNLVPVT